jgi:hypothetical protein
VDEIRLDGNELHVKGNYRALARAVSLSKEGKLGEVPSFVPEWRARKDSNSLPLGSQDYSCFALRRTVVKAYHWISIRAAFTSLVHFASSARSMS